jgi:hypothetical protein
VKEIHRQAPTYLLAIDLPGRRCPGDLTAPVSATGCNPWWPTSDGRIDSLIIVGHSMAGLFSPVTTARFVASAEMVAGLVPPTALPWWTRFPVFGLVRTPHREAHHQKGKASV